ncbi:MAG: PIN domain-containing protein [Chloroflexi bacterium]|nr:PIN domain-containing protein [Chloroflexota bacterium]
MGSVFADAGYWIALWHSRDSLHAKASEMASALGTTSLVTTQMVLTEALDAMAGLGSFRRLYAAQMVRELQRSPQIEIISQSDAQFDAALERYAARADQTWGLTDCASFLVMEEKAIAEALAYDRDFEQAGFVALLRADQNSGPQGRNVPSP